MLLLAVVGFAIHPDESKDASPDRLKLYPN
jgi:hypothetical protein